jgi:predicted transcriptional regulator
MAFVSFTQGVDPELRAEIDKTARFENRRASWVANLAIRGFVDERQATKGLVHEELRQVAAGAPSILSEEVRDLLRPRRSAFSGRP